MPVFKFARVCWDFCGHFIDFVLGTFPGTVHDVCCDILPSTMVQRNMGFYRDKNVPCYHSLVVDASPALVGRGGHLGVKSDILSYYIILLGMFIGYAIFHRSVPIIRAQHSQRGPPDVCDLLKLYL